MGISYSPPRKRSKDELKEKLNKLEEKNKRLEEELKSLKSKLNQPVVVQPIQKVENVGNPKISIALPSSIEQQRNKELPIWKLFKPGVYFEYGGDSREKYEVLNVGEEIIEFRTESLYKDGSKNIYYEYIGKDRRYWVGWDYNKLGVGGAHRRWPFEDLKLTDKVTDLWIDTRNLNIGDIVPLYAGVGKVLSVEHEDKRKLYLLKYEMSHPFSFYNYYDKRTGLFIKSLSGSPKDFSWNLIKKLVSTNISF